MAHFDYTPSQLVTAVRGHAARNYSRGGWDVVVEAMDDAAIIVIIGRAATPDGAIRKVGAHVGTYDAVRADAIAAGGGEPY